MVAGARTLSIEDTFFGPQILNPPPTRHALLAFLVALAAILHIGTAAWGDIYDHTEGEIAGTARAMLDSGDWLAPTRNGTPALQRPPLTYWILGASCKIFGVTATAIRIPIALAMIGSVAITFLLGERLAGYWRGFAAGLIHLCSVGGFLLGRMASPSVFVTLFISAAIYCAVRGYLHRNRRRLWYAGFWFCGSLACLAGGLHAILFPAGVCLLLAVFYREARIRFLPLLHWSHLVLFLLLVAPWFIWARLHFPWFVFGSSANGPPLWRILAGHLAWWFPALFLLLPGLVAAPRKIFRPHEFFAPDALPLFWLAVTILLTLLFGEGTEDSALIALPGFALFAASAWERSSRSLRTAGITFALLIGLLFFGLVAFAPGTLENALGRSFPDGFWTSMRPLAQASLATLLIFSTFAVVIVTRQRAEIVLLIAIGAMAPIGFCLAEARSRAAPFFSLADAARFLNPRLGGSGEVVLEGSVQSGSSLTFYLDKKFYYVNQAPGPLERDPESQRKCLDEHFMLEAWDRSNPIYLIIDEERVSYWRKLITQRVHIYHQVTTCGSRVILSNQL
jgi:4-amino-4-deoxy-L-arabinose transferase-like glycosyltransferase